MFSQINYCGAQTISQLCCFLFALSRQRKWFFITFFLLFLSFRNNCRILCYPQNRCGGWNAQNPHPFLFFHSLAVRRIEITIRSKARRNNKKYNFNVCCKFFSSLFLKVVWDQGVFFSGCFIFFLLVASMSAQKLKSASRKNYFHRSWKGRPSEKKVWFNVLSLVLMPKRYELHGYFMFGFLCSPLLSSIASCSLLHNAMCDTLLLWMKKRGLKGGRRAERLTVCSKVNKKKHVRSRNMNVTPLA